MPSFSRVMLAGAVGAVLAVTAAAPASPAGTAGQVPATGPAPGAPGVDEQYLPADKSGVGTSATPASTVWLTVQKDGGLGEIYYPDLGTPGARALGFVVADRRGGAVRAEDGVRCGPTSWTPRA